MSDVKNVLIVGVGGQGTILASRVLSGVVQAAGYDVKVKQYFSQNILAQTLNQQKYTSNPGFLAFMNNTRLPFKDYKEFKRVAINERTDLYRAILEYEFGEYKG